MCTYIYIYTYTYREQDAQAPEVRAEVVHAVRQDLISLEHQRTTYMNTSVQHHH